MKKVKAPFANLFIVLAAILLLVSCSKEYPNIQADEFKTTVDEAVARSSNNITLTPSGDATGTTDANAIESALNTTGVKTVHLAAGTYYLNRVVQAPAEFDGSLKGDGQSNTSVVGVGTSGIPFLAAPVYIPLQPYPFQASAFFYFPDPSGSLTISDFSMSIPNGFVAETGWEGTQNLSAFIAVKLGSDVPDVTMRNLSMTGTDAIAGSPDWYFNQPILGAYIVGDRGASDFPQPSNAGGKIRFQQSQISKTAFQALILEVFKDAELTVSQNSFTDTKQINIRFLDGCNVKVKDNFFSTSSWGSIVITQELASGYGPIAGDPTDVKVQNNSITSNGFLGIEIGGIPFPGAAPFNILIEGNTITMGADPLGNIPNVAGIGIYEGHEAAIVRYNTLLGEANYGVFFIGVDGSIVLQNSTAGFSPSDADYGLIGSSDNNQVTVTEPSTVIDEGSGNTYIGPITIL